MTSVGCRNAPLPQASGEFFPEYKGFALLCPNEHWTLEIWRLEENGRPIAVCSPKVVPAIRSGFEPSIVWPRQKIARARAFGAGGRGGKRKPGGARGRGRGRSRGAARGGRLPALVDAPSDGDDSGVEAGDDVAVGSESESGGDIY